MNKGFLDIKPGDVIIVSDEYAHDYNEHHILIESIENEKEFINGDINPTGKRCYGKDLTYWDDNLQDYNSDDYITVVTEGNFIRFSDLKNIVDKTHSVKYQVNEILNNTDTKTIASFIDTHLNDGLYPECFIKIPQDKGIDIVKKLFDYDTTDTYEKLPAYIQIEFHPEDESISLGVCYDADYFTFDEIVIHNEELKNVITKTFKEQMSEDKKLYNNEDLDDYENEF